MIVDSETFRTPKTASFIVFEGVNGCGKTTLSKAIQAGCHSSGRKFLATFEPGDTPLGKTIRSLLLNPDSPRVAPVTELLLFAADRSEHVKSVIEPARDQGVLVLCDRYVYSTAAFQGYGRGIDRAFITQLERYTTGNVVPDLVVLLDLDPSIGLERAGKRVTSGGDRLEGEDLAFHERIRQGFLEIARERPEPFVVLDATLPPETLASTVRRVVQV